MATEAIIQALSRVREQAEAKNGQIVCSTDISRSDRELLVATGWLQEIMRGWYMLVRPDVATGDTAAWYANFWDFVHLYLKQRFGDDYCLSAESSIDLHVENPTVPKQLIVIAKQGTGLRRLMYDTSLMIYADSKTFPQEITQKQGINVMTLAYALCKVTPTYFKNNFRNAELALRSIKTPSDISRIIIRYNLKTAAARIIGAYQFLKDNGSATTISNDLATVGILVKPNNPFNQSKPLLTTARLKSPYAGRIQAMWNEARDTVINNFPTAPGLPQNPINYLDKIDKIYKYDAYNSLSIEGYQVTDELIERVKDKNWDPDQNEHDSNSRNAMAARGYFDAFQQVKMGITRIVEGENAAQIVKENLQLWYQKLFSPSVQAGIIPAEALLGYRNDRVFIRNSRHSPPPKEAVLDAMEAFFTCLENEPNHSVNAILGHYFFVFIHPYMDGNGRIARFLMNTFLAAGGYPWTVVRVDNRSQYISTLEQTHLQFDLKKFTKFIATEMKYSANLKSNESTFG
ncbi:MAG: Fic family protein [Gammaproteobacteria bacterium]|nr:Fic family protein [Gammaproteobacteria bacterium]